MYNVLICDDEMDILAPLKVYISGNGYNVFEASNGKEALEILEKEKIDLVLMDVMMPVMDGITATVKLRETSNVPVILLTAKSEDTDKVLGLNIGADDYITKPFNPVEVLARIKSQIRRFTHLGGSQQSDEATLVNGGIEIVDKTKTVFLDGESISLTPTEYDILKFFMEHPGEVFSPKEIYRNVWNDEPFGAENTVTVHIRHLREKLEINPSDPRYFKVVWGHGYKLEKQ